MSPARLARPLLLLALLAACATSAPKPAAPPPTPAAAAPGPAAQAAPAAPAADARTTPPLGAPKDLVLPPQRHFTLANGLRVRLVEEHRLPIVQVQLVVDAGAARDPLDRPGLAGFTAAMLTEGTRTRSATQLSDQLGYLGASLGGGAGVDGASLGGGSLSRHLPRLLELFADALTVPAFRPADVTRVRDQRLVALLQQRDQPGWLASRAFTEAFWGKHPYGHQVIGTEASLQAITPEDLRRFHAQRWRPASAELVVVGDVTEEALRPLLERTLGSWPAGQAAPAPAAQAPAAPHRTLLIDKPEASQTYLLLGMPGLDRRSPDYAAADVMFQVLGGGASSRLFRSLREAKGYTYGLSAGADARALGGASVVRGSVKADVTGAALTDLLAELARLREQPVPAEELRDAVDGMLGALPADFSTVGGIAGRVSELVIYGLPDDHWNRYADQLRAVTAADVQRVAQRYLDPSRMTLVLVGTPGVVKPQLASVPLGPLQLLPAPGEKAAAGKQPAARPPGKKVKRPAPPAPAAGPR
ncbi:MAG: pitrilysin family protein [Anaeromyxobacter sp.]